MYIYIYIYTYIYILDYLFIAHFLIIQNRIVGDNLDLEQTARIQNHKTPNKTQHWFQIYAVKDRVTCSDFLPTTEVHTALLNDLTFLLPRIIVQYLPAYECFTNSVTWHINQKHADDMKKKSEVVNMWYISYISIIWFIARRSLKR